MNLIKDLIIRLNIKFIYLKLIELTSEFLKKTIIRKIDKNLLVFAGDDFLGNTKYLYLFLNRYSKYRIVWLSKKNSTIMDLRKRDFEAYNRISIHSLILLLKARYIFITHGYHDILPINLSTDSKLIYLAHGNPFKRPVTDAKNYRNIFSSRYDYELLLKLFRTINYHFSCSDKFNDILKKAYHMNKNNIITIGYPRNDLLFCKDIDFISNIKKKIKIPSNIKNIIIYAPTFREHKIAKFPLDPQLLIKLDNELEDKNSIILLKPHKFEESIKFEKLKNFIIIPQKQDIQELLLISDVLITDYSSVFLDYILTRRKIIFFAYDLDYYRNTRGDLYFDYESFVPGPIVKTGEELIKKIRTLSSWNLDYKEKIEEILKFSHKYIDGKSCERTCKFLKLRINF